MKKRTAPRRKLSGKALARIVSASVFLLSTALVVLTVVFFTKTLSNVATAQRIDTSKSAKLAGIDGALLDALLTFHERRTGATPIDSASVANPFDAPPPDEPASAAAPTAAPAAPTPPAAQPVPAPKP